MFLPLNSGRYKQNIVTTVIQNYFMCTLLVFLFASHPRSITKGLKLQKKKKDNKVEYVLYLYFQ